MPGRGSDFMARLDAMRGVERHEAPLRIRPAGESDAAILTVQRDLAHGAEAVLCDRLGAALEAQGYDVFFEVPFGGGQPDVVGIRGDETIAIEAKRFDIKGVVKQGLRAARHVDRAYLALPLRTYPEAAASMDRLARKADEGGRGHALPGVILVGPDAVKVVRAAVSAPRRRIAPEVLRRMGELLGEERGGTPGGDRTERNLLVYRAWSGGLPVALVARRKSLTEDAVRRIIIRTDLDAGHLSWCAGLPCGGADWIEVEGFKRAHKHGDAIRGLPRRPLDEIGD
jgi:hypothetical protein